MGYELDRLMQQFGVSSPTLTYSGMQKPVKPVDLAATASTMDRANYDALLAKYNADLPLYQSDQDKYKTYSDDYKNRLATTSLYDAPQFQRGAMSSPGTGMFTDQYSQMYQDVLGRVPDPAGLAYWKSKFGDMISPEEYADFRQSATGELNDRLPVYISNRQGGNTSSRTVLNQPTYSTPTQAPILQTAANNPVTNATVGESPAGGENPPNTTPDWGTALSIGQTLSNMGLTTIGDHLQSEGRMGINAQTGAYSQTAQDQRAAEAAAMAAQTANNFPTGYIDPGAYEGSLGPSAGMGGLTGPNYSDYGGMVGETGGPDGFGGEYAKGGYIKGYADGGPVDSRLYGETDEVATGPGYSVPPIDPRLQSLASKYQQPGFQPSFAPGSIDPGQSQMDMIRADALQNGLGAPVINISADKPPMSSNMAALQQMLMANQYKSSPYADDLRAARAAANSQTVAFNKMLQDAIKGQEDSGPSKAETYFRLAAAFGAPTKTGHFAEGLAEANKSMADQAKETRLSNKAGQALKLQLGLEGAKAGMATAREDVNALRALTGEEMKEKAAYQRKLIKDYFTSGKAQSSAGKQAIDEGLVQGSPEFQARVKTISDEEFKKLTAGVDASVAAAQATAASAARADATAKLDREKFEASKAKTKADAAKLSGPEIKMKDETSQALVTMKDAYADLVKALELSANAYDGSFVDQAQYKLLSEAGNKDPKVVNTGVLDNLLKLGALSTAATTLKTQISDSDMKMLNQVQGAGAKSRQERDAILKAAMVRLENMYREKKSKLADITSGKYRIATPEIAEEIE